MLGNHDPTLSTDCPLMTADWSAKHHVHAVGHPLGVSDVHTAQHRVYRGVSMFKQFVHQLTYPVRHTIACCILCL